MYAIVEIAGQQFKVEKDQEVYVNKLQGSEGDQVTFDKVMITADGDKYDIGSPKVKVNATILEHVKGDKVTVFKKKRRKGYKVKNGHRQQYTRIKIIDIK